MQDVLWCFSQVKGTIDTGVIESKFIFPFVAVTKKNLSHTSCLAGVQGGHLRAVGSCWYGAKLCSLVSALVVYLCI